MELNGSVWLLVWNWDYNLGLLLVSRCFVQCLCETFAALTQTLSIGPNL